MEHSMKQCKSIQIKNFDMILKEIDVLNMMTNYQILFGDMEILDVSEINNILIKNTDMVKNYLLSLKGIEDVYQKLTKDEIEYAQKSLDQNKGNIRNLFMNIKLLYLKTLEKYEG
jgi:hypothetical protein